MQEGFERWLVVRRSIEDPEELTAYTVFCAEGTPPEKLAKVAGTRSRVEIGFEEAKGEVGLAHYEVRCWHGWYRHITLSLFAHAFLAAIRSAGLEVHRRRPEKGGRKSPANLSEFKRRRGLSWS
jgi:SRSO17 transposase